MLHPQTSEVISLAYDSTWRETLTAQSLLTMVGSIST